MSNETHRTEVEVIRLVNGEVPAEPIWITDDRIDRTLLDNVVEVRQPELMADVARLGGVSASHLDEQLRFWARVLKEVAPDFLDGDLAPIDEADALIRSRVAENPQQVQLWISSDAPAGAESERLDEITATVPPNVAVSVRRYRSGGASRSQRDAD